MEEDKRVLKDLELIENSNMWINEKKYYVNLIDFLFNLGYYKDRKSIKEIWKNGANRDK